MTRCVFSIPFLTLAACAPTETPSDSAPDATSESSDSEVEDTSAIVDSDSEGETADTAVETGVDSAEDTEASNEPPTVSLFGPGGDVFYHQCGVEAWVTVIVDDADETDLTKLLLTWSGSAAELGIPPNHPDSSGGVVYALDLANLNEILALTVQVTDSEDATSNATVLFEVVEGDVDCDGALSTEYGGDDCDDANLDIRPGRTEVCDGVDNNCDGVVDPGC